MRQLRAGLFVQIRGVLSGGGGKTSKRPAHIRIELLLKKRDYLMPQAIAGVGRGGIALIRAPRLAALFHERPHFPRSPAEQRAHEAAARPADAGEAIQTRPADDIEQHGLGEVVGGMAGGDEMRPARVRRRPQKRQSLVAGGLLGRLRPKRVRAGRGERHAKLLAERGDECFIVIGAGAHAVVVVGREDRPPELGDKAQKREKERGAVGSARHRRHNARARGDQRAAVDIVSHMLQKHQLPVSRVCHCFTKRKGRSKRPGR